MVLNDIVKVIPIAPAESFKQLNGPEWIIQAKRMPRQNHSSNWMVLNESFKQMNDPGRIIQAKECPRTNHSGFRQHIVTISKKWCTWKAGVINISIPRWYFGRIGFYVFLDYRHKIVISKFWLVDKDIKVYNMDKYEWLYSTRKSTLLAPK